MKKIFLIIIIIILALSITSCSAIEELLLYEASYNNEAQHIDGQLLIDVIDVGQGDSILIITPEGKTMLIDSGEANAYKSVSNSLKKYSVSTIDWLVATHPHSDHIGCMYKIVSDYNIGKVYMPNIAHTSKTYEKLLKNIKNKKIQTSVARSGLEIDMGSGILCKFFSPVKDKEYNDLNDYSPIMKITYGKTSFLTTGDAGFENESDAIKYNKELLDSDVIKIAHHGSDTATSADFLNAVSPFYALISVGKDNKYGHPCKETLDILKKNGIPVIRTDKEGDIIIVSDGKKISVNDKNIDTSIVSASKTDFVYKTKSGKTYHKENCTYIKGNSERLTIDEAKKLGLKPCSRCIPK